jgi:hypothetical protein
MKNIGSISISDVPLGMLILNKKNNKYYIADIDEFGNKKWLLCNCPTCNHKKQSGGTTQISTDLAPSPEEHSWHHHHAPFYQVFNNYVCVKRDTLGEIRDFFMEMFSNKNYLERKAPFTI